MTRRKVDKSSQTDEIFGRKKNSYYLRPRKKMIKLKSYFRRSKRNQNIQKLHVNQFRFIKKENSFSSLKLPVDSNSNRSSTTRIESSRSKSSNISSDDEIIIRDKKERTIIPLSSSLTSMKRRKKNFNLKRPQTCPSNLSLRIISSNCKTSSSNKTEMIGKIEEENEPQRAGVSLSDVVLRQKESYLESAHQSTSDKGLKLRFPRKRSIRTSLKDVLFPPKSKRRLIENSYQNSRDEEKHNFFDLCSGSVEPMSNDLASDAFMTVMVQQEKYKETVKENLNEDRKLTDNAFGKKSQSSPRLAQEESCTRKNLNNSEEFNSVKNLQLMTKYFKDAIYAMIVKKEKESRDFELNTKTICSSGDKQEASGLLSKTEEIVGTNEDAEKNNQDPEPGTERKVDRFRNLLEKISMLRGDVKILLEDAGKNDKTLEFLKNLRNLSRSSNPESQERLLIGGNINENSPQTLTQKMSEIKSQIYSPGSSNIPISSVQIEAQLENQLSHENGEQSKLDNISMIDEDDDIQILKVISNRNRPNFNYSETNHLDGDYHFLMSLYQQLNKMPQGRKLKMRLKMQQLFYDELCTVDSD